MTKAKTLLVFLAFLAVFGLIALTPPHEGMFPLGDHKLDLKKAGLKIDQSEVYNAGGVGLIDALVNVGGCASSFVSNDGSIITNYHCAFSAVQLANALENDYVNKGYLAEISEE